MPPDSLIRERRTMKTKKQLDALIANQPYAAKSRMQVKLLQYLFEQEVKSIEDRIRQEGAE